MDNVFKMEAHTAGNKSIFDGDKKSFELYKLNFFNYLKLMQFWL